MAIDPAVDTIFEIGGQDSKFIRLEQGAITNFAMNSACAAGTGSFLEEQAVRLELNIENEFSQKAFCADCPVGLGERCTVFMESDLVHHQQQGAGTEDLAAGLAYAIVENYLNRVVGTRTIGRRIFFQGGVAHNQSVVAAFQTRTGQVVTVPPHHDVSGAIGAALLARDEMRHRNGDGGETRFRGFDLSARTYVSKSFICQACPNLCELNRVTIADEPPIYYGARCDMYDNAQVDRRRQSTRTLAELPDLFADRQRLLMGDYQAQARRAGRPRVGLPRVLHFFDMFPYWRAFFDELGMDLVISSTTNAGLAGRAREHATTEVCYPVKLVYGHLDELRNQDLDFLFYPVIMNRESPAPGQDENTYCPYIRTAGYLAAATMDLAAGGAKPVMAALNMQWPEYLQRDLAVIAREFGVRARAVEMANVAGLAALETFHTALRARGQEVLATLTPDQPAVVLVGRAYNTVDPGVSLDLPYKLRKLDTLPIPIDFLPLEQANVAAYCDNMFWYCGQHILAAAEIIRNDPRLLRDLCDELLMRTRLVHHQPVPAHDGRQTPPRTGNRRTHGGYRSDDALRGLCRKPPGAPLVNTVAYACFLRRLTPYAPSTSRAKKRGVRMTLKRVLIPYMSDHSYIAQAAMRHFDLPGEAMLPPDQESTNIGIGLSLGKECNPCVYVVGDVIRRLRQPDCDPKETAVFNSTAEGPCRYGQYHVLLRHILDEQGFSETEILCPTASNAYNGFGPLPNAFRMLMWRGIVALDLLQALLHHHRPYEGTPGEADQIYRAGLDNICAAVQQGGGPLVQAMRQIGKEFRRLPVDRSTPRPQIGLVGELYVRHNSLSNRNLIRRVEALGGEIVLATVMEYLYYVNWWYAYKQRRHGHRREVAKSILTDTYQRFLEFQLARPVSDLLIHRFESRAQLDLCSIRPNTWTPRYPPKP